MERSEAIALLQNLKVGVGKYDEALKMAVEALKSQEQFTEQEVFDGEKK